MIVEVLVKPGSSKGPLVEVAPFDGLLVYVREKAHDNEANEAVRRLLADYYGVAKSCVSLVGGGKSRKKRFEIIGK